MMANYFAAQEPNEKSHEEYAIHKGMYFTTVDRITTAKLTYLRLKLMSRLKSISIILEFPYPYIQTC